MAKKYPNIERIKLILNLLTIDSHDDLSFLGHIYAIYKQYIINIQLSHHKLNGV